MNKIFYMAIGILIVATYDMIFIKPSNIDLKTFQAVHGTLIFLSICCVLFYLIPLAFKFIFISDEEEGPYEIHEQHFSKKGS